MPKKPHNAYFYFCQEFRPSVLSSLQRRDHDSPPDKREVASVLTAKWNALTFDQKQVSCSEINTGAQWTEVALNQCPWLGSAQQYKGWVNW